MLFAFPEFFADFTLPVDGLGNEAGWESGETQAAVKEVCVYVCSSIPLAPPTPHEKGI